MHGRPRMTDQAGEPAWSEVRAPSCFADHQLLLRRRAPGRSPWPGTAIESPPSRPACELISSLPAPPPPVRGRRRDVQTGRGLPERRSRLDQRNKRRPARRSELRLMVLTHPGPPVSGVLADTRSLRTGPDVTSAVHKDPGLLI